MSGDLRQPSVFSALASDSKNRLLEISNSIGDVRMTAQHSYSIQPLVLRTECASERLDLINKVREQSSIGVPAIYFFSTVGSTNLQDIQLAFRASQTESTRCFSRDGNRISSHLYVGSSMNLPKRLKEHLGFGPAKTYSLQLAHWAKDLNESLKFEFAVFDPASPPNALQALEDTLWDTLEPMFGRRGVR